MVAGDGRIILAADLVSATVLFSIVCRGRASRFGDCSIGVVAGLVCLAVSVIALVNLVAITSDLEITVRVQIGWGLWLTALSSAVLVATGLSAAWRPPRA
ncbi:hypothetical protein [Rhodococcus rhodochrous]|uniref:Uncharacterized protein n=1 Tax=Rhodococcus rhodochrous TaxID=1829 RepID=A0AA46WX46_RHORH|nr:hypothetical protein [Rhodococcus rhodochrous]UZF45737.1 hypothetical protein KUM34_003350 [Rhodococcus rhodochrous]